MSIIFAVYCSTVEFKIKSFLKPIGFRTTNSNRIKENIRNCNNTTGGENVLTDTKSPIVTAGNFKHQTETMFVKQLD